MVIANTHPDHGTALEPVDAAMLGAEGAAAVERVLAARQGHGPTPLHALPALACELGVGAIHIKDEGFRLGLGSFKALGGATAIVRLVLEEAERRLGRALGVADLAAEDVRAVAADMTFGCATDGNHGRSVAMGVQWVDARSAVFVHAGVSAARVEAIARFGARMIRVAGTYDDSVATATRVCATEGWIIVSDTSWPGYERIPGLVMQGYTVLVRESLEALPAPPTHVFMQAGVGGLAAAVAGHLAIKLGEARPRFIVVEPERAACLFASAEAGHLVHIAHDKPTVMAMLECYAPSLVAWRILSRVADGFMTIGEAEAVAVMNRLARPSGDDPAIVSGESGGAGLAGLIRAAGDPAVRAGLGLGPESRVWLVNTEGATDPALYAQLVRTDAPRMAPAA